MQFTSHFVGVKFPENALSGLFVVLKQYVQNHSLHDSIVLVEPSTLHITLYYLDKTLSKSDKVFIKKFISDHQYYDDVCLQNLQFFSHNNDLKVGYLSVLEEEPFRTMNCKLRESLSHDHIADNDFDFVPHCTLFLIKNSRQFADHKTNIENIVQTYLKTNTRVRAEGIYLYGVNSASDFEKFHIYSPEEIGS